MSYDAFGCFAYTINDDTVRSLSPELFDNFINEYKENDDDDVSLIIEQVAFDEKILDNQYPELDKLLEDIENKHGLIITLNYLSSDDISQYSDFDVNENHYWNIENAVQFTPEAKAIEQHITLKTFAIFG